MDLKEIKNMSLKMIETFVNSIDLDGEFYASTCNCPMAWGRPKLNAEGEFITPNSERLNTLLAQTKWEDKTKKNINSRGLILVNSKYRTQELDANLFVTLIHEILHSNRCLMIYDAVREDSNENAYTYQDGKFNQNTFDYNFTYVDASQDLLKSNIDNSNDNIDILNKKTSDQLDEMEFKSGKRDEIMEKQQIVDESLVELMSFLAYKLYKDIENGKNANIWESIEELSNHYEGTDIGFICKIILRHQDLMLFGWMLDPIAYSFENIHYDFFKDYTKNDQDLLDDRHF